MSATSELCKLRRCDRVTGTCAAVVTYRGQLGIYFFFGTRHSIAEFSSQGVSQEVKKTRKDPKDICIQLMTQARILDSRKSIHEHASIGTKE